MRRPLLCTLFAVSAGFAGTQAASAAQFDSWAALVVAGDYRTHSGSPSEIFDNGRRDIVKALQGLGFAQSHILQFSVVPDTDKTTKPKLSDSDAIRTEFARLARQSGGGCFVYFTSHGGQNGILVGGTGMSPRDMAKLVSDACADRTTVIVISACYSGIFIPMLRSDTRLILTAARADRPSFGCGETDKYTFFDQCVLESFPGSRDFPRLAFKVQDCVAAREKAEKIDLPSEPQVSIGGIVQQLLSQYVFPPR